MNLNNEVFIVNTVITILVIFVFSKLHDKWYLLERMEGNGSYKLSGWHSLKATCIPVIPNTWWDQFSFNLQKYTI